MKNYALNPRNGKIHIVGYCQFGTPPSKEWKLFNTEEEARAYFGGQSAGICKLCLSKREELLRKENRKK